jgi:hypothetical protein
VVHDRKGFDVSVVEESDPRHVCFDAPMAAAASLQVWCVGLTEPFGGVAFDGQCSSECFEASCEGVESVVAGTEIYTAGGSELSLPVSISDLNIYGWYGFFEGGTTCSEELGGVYLSGGMGGSGLVLPDDCISLEP